jgi:hypothetical protein
MISPFSKKNVDVNPFNTNPALDVLKAEYAWIAPAISRGETPPTMFAGGDLPSFMASGLDPNLLTKLPWKMRHGAAAEPDPQKVYDYLQNYSDNDMYEIPHPDLRQFVGTMTTWAKTAGIDNQAETDNN